MKVVGFGKYIPNTFLSSELIAKAGGNPEAWTGWKKISVASGEDHPSSMAEKALQQALAESQIDLNEVKLLISTSISRDYLPTSYANSIELMKRVGLPGTCVAMDLNMGCATNSLAFETAKLWLEARGGGHAIIVGAEKWTHTIDRKTPSTFCNWGDGASAIILSLRENQKSIGKYLGSSFYTRADMSDAILAKYGGTRFPKPPQEIEFPSMPYFRLDLDGGLISMAYGKALKIIFSDLKKRFGSAEDGLKIDWVICNQTSPEMPKFLAPAAGVKIEQIVLTGDHHGHIGCSDSVLGMMDLNQRNLLKGRIITTGTSPFSWGISLFEF